MRSSSFFRCRYGCLSIALLGVFALLAPYGPVAAQSADAGHETIYVRVNGRPIMRATLESVAENLERQGTQAREGELLAELVNLELLAQAAEADRLERDPEVAAALQLQYTQTMANAWLAAAEAAYRPTTDELEQAYADYLEAHSAEEFRLTHVLVPDEATAREAIAALDADEPIASVVERFAGDSTDSGDLGWLTAETMLPAFRDAVDTLALGQHTREPVRTAYGWHVLRLLEVRPAAAPPIAAVRPELRAGLVQASLLERLAALRAEADIDYTDAGRQISDALNPPRSDPATESRDP